MSIGRGLRRIGHASAASAHIRWRRLFTMVMIVVLPARLTMQAPTAPDAVFSTRADLVVLQVTVTDRAGAYVGDLPPEAFAVVEDDRPQTVRLVADTDTPVTVGLLVDNSASMHAHRRLVMDGVARFAATSLPGDEMFALAFNEQVEPALPALSPFTSDGAVLHAALDRRLTTRGRTALYDAIWAGVTYLSRGTRERKALIVLSDGGDNASRTTQREAVRRAQASNAVVYTVGLRDRASRDANPALLVELAKASGGESFQPDSPRELTEALERIAQGLRHTYTLGYTSTNTARDGTFRRVRVVVTPPPGLRRPLAVRTRAGYVAEGAAP